MVVIDELFHFDLLSFDFDGAGEILFIDASEFVLTLLYTDKLGGRVGRRLQRRFLSRWRHRFEVGSFGGGIHGQLIVFKLNMGHLAWVIAKLQ